ncbi:hypothetical protein LHYA1_G006993 [Lachnellula hyalina]|uniref:Uncharacterized protein n=1 Tax=Lachnellula hyalina TaxID=1316788 RepID=A0A8H8TYU8_9HELO|nr:uncharacterized protein LHYA1_G006993 [Lachnellula hyalina]TVY25252.1 hypothetical protein LHYA1_G006993 [Lachnellula hyalina]
MVQLSTMTIVLTSVLSTLVAAKSCKRGGIYCGKSLLDRGDYITKLDTNLKANDKPDTQQYRLESLWTCLEHGDISFIQYCATGCLGNGNNDDSCTDDAAADAAAEAAKRDVGIAWVA